MKAIKHIKLEQEVKERRSKKTCKHNVQEENCVWRDAIDKKSQGKWFRQVINRARMFSPSSWVKSIREFKQQVLESRKKEKLKIEISQSKLIEGYDNPDNQMNSDPNQLELMLNIHNNLMMKTTKLVEKVKKFKYGGFFSPRRLRNRIKIGNFSQLLCSPEVNLRRWLSPNERMIIINKKTDSLLVNRANKHITNKIWKADITYNSDTFNSDFIVNHIKNNETLMKNLSPDKFQKNKKQRSFSNRRWLQENWSKN